MRCAHTHTYVLTTKGRDFRLATPDSLNSAKEADAPCAPCNWPFPRVIACSRRSARATGSCAHPPWWHGPRSSGGSAFRVALLSQDPVSPPRAPSPGPSAAQRLPGPRYQTASARLPLPAFPSPTPSPCAPSRPRAAAALIPTVGAATGRVHSMRTSVSVRRAGVVTTAALLW
jgi:hypothetical protein